mgnify:CR=1 FL=1
MTIAAIHRCLHSSAQAYTNNPWWPPCHLYDGIPIPDSLHLQNCQTIDYKDQECFDKGIESKKMKVDLVLPNYNVGGDYFYFKFVVKNRSRIDYKLNTFKFIVQ